MRKTTPADVLKITEFIRDYFEEAKPTFPAPLDFDLEQSANFIFMALQHPNVISYIADDGVILGELAHTWFGPNKLARGILWYVRPGARNGILARRLLKAFDGEAKARGARLCLNDLHNPAHLNMIDGFVKKIGYRSYSKCYLKEL